MPVNETGKVLFHKGRGNMAIQPRDWYDGPPIDENGEYVRTSPAKPAPLVAAAATSKEAPTPVGASLAAPISAPAPVQPPLSPIAGADSAPAAQPGALPPAAVLKAMSKTKLAALAFSRGIPLPENLDKISEDKIRKLLEKSR